MEEINEEINKDIPSTTDENSYLQYDLDRPTEISFHMSGCDNNLEENTESYSLYSDSDSFDSISSIASFGKKSYNNSNTSWITELHDELDKLVKNDIKVTSIQCTPAAINTKTDAVTPSSPDILSSGTPPRPPHICRDGKSPQKRTESTNHLNETNNHIKPSVYRLILCNKAYDQQHIHSPPTYEKSHVLKSRIINERSKFNATCDHPTQTELSQKRQASRFTQTNLEFNQKNINYSDMNVPLYTDSYMPIPWSRIPKLINNQNRQYILPPRPTLVNSQNYRVIDNHTYDKRHSPPVTQYMSPMSYRPYSSDFHDLSSNDIEFINLKSAYNVYEMPFSRKVPHYTLTPRTIRGNPRSSSKSPYSQFPSDNEILYKANTTHLQNPRSNDIRYKTHYPHQSLLRLERNYRNSSNLLTADTSSLYRMPQNHFVFQRQQNNQEFENSMQNIFPYR
ncbi:hypothetical protein GJ496_002858 [Pomphorhynchus laevis]|nr:hypothetical protein GJ496_002858 [Pomphorhynchus laevis]